MQRILIADDDPELLSGLEHNLKREGYEVSKASNADTALAAALARNPSLIVLDVMLPGANGLDVCRELRRRGLEMPVILLTAKSAEVDKVVGLEAGADDYITKPFSVRELIARIRAHLRRTPVTHGRISRIKFGDVSVDFDKLQCTRGGIQIDLTSREFDILRILGSCSGSVVTRDRLLVEVCGYDVTCTTRAIDTHIARLRRKLERNPGSPSHIISVYGSGYKLIF